MTGYKVVVDQVDRARRHGATRCEAAHRRARRDAAVRASASNPEFLKEGDAVNDFMKPGSRHHRRRRRARARGACATSTRRSCAPTTASLSMDARSAELTKYASNAMLATRISLHERHGQPRARSVGADIEMVRRGMGIGSAHRRQVPLPRRRLRRLVLPQGRQGAACDGARARRPLEILEAVHRGQRAAEARARRQDRSSTSAATCRGKTIAVWGLAFKPRHRRHPRGAGADGDRAAARGGRHACTAHDPVANEARAAKCSATGSTFAELNYDAAEGADALALVTEWHQFRRPDFEAPQGAHDASRVLFDGRNIWEPDEVRALGFTYYGIGRALRR